MQRRSLHESSVSSKGEEAPGGSRADAWHAERLLPQMLVAEHSFERVEIGIGAQLEAELLLLFDLWRN